MCLSKPELLHMLGSSQFVKVKVDQTVAVLKQSEMLKELFPLIQSLVPDVLAKKITGMRIEHYNPEQNKSLKAAIQRAYKVCMVLYQGDVMYM